MKVAVVIDLWGKGGGGNIFVRKLRGVLQEKGHEVEVLTNDESLCTIKIPFSEKGGIFRLMGVIRARKRIEKELARVRPDVVLILSPVAALASSGAVTEGSGFKTIYAPRYLALDHWKNIEKGLSRKIKQMMEKRALKLEYDQVFALNENMKVRMEKAGVKSPVKIVPIGVDTERFKPIEKETEKPKVLFAGRFEAVKGVDIFIEASKQFEDVKFVMVGDNVKKLGDVPPNLEVKGKVPHRKMVDLYNEAFAVALPSYSEGLPRVCLEALACGTPVVASKVGGVPELVIDGETGILIEPGSVKQLAGGIDKLLKNPKLAKEMGRKGRALIAENYDEQKIMERTVQALRDD